MLKLWVTVWENKRTILRNKYFIFLYKYKMSKKYKLLEIFKGTGSVGKVAKKNFDIVSLDLDPYYTPTIETDILEWDYKKWYEENKFTPDFIWASPPCNTYSPLAYPLKERNPATAEPIKERAKIGTKILYRTLDIIEFFKTKNPNLLYVLENPRGMMRKDKRIKKLILNNTLYCLYGDKRRKSTDFFSNFPLDLKFDTKCPNKTVGVVDLPLDERYKIPSKLIKHIFDEFYKQYKGRLRGGAKKTIISQLEEIGLNPDKYLNVARENAEENGYKNFDKLEFSDNRIHKLQIPNEEGQMIRFGRVGYGDFLIWSYLEAKGKASKGQADKKRNVFRKSHIALSEKRNIIDPYAPNNLAINILWA